MPHKHKRLRGTNDAFYDLPPSITAKPLPVKRATAPSSKSLKRHKNNVTGSKRTEKGSYSQDDTPKAFTRLLQFQSARKGPKGLGDGRPKKSQPRHGHDGMAAPLDSAETLPKIQPGERLSDFAARVDRTMPIAGLARKNTSVPGVKERQTRMEKKLQKMQAQWRLEEARIREKEAEARELAEEEEEEMAARFGSGIDMLSSQTQPHKSKRKRRNGVSTADDDEDPWATLAATRERPKGLHDVVQAPPVLKQIPMEKFKVKSNGRATVADIPNSAGSLRRREDLGEERMNVIQNYRSMLEKRQRRI